MGEWLSMIATWGLFGYLCGSIPFGFLLTRAAGLGDIRAIGSGNIGATNVLRTGNKGLAAATLLLDALKGAVPVLVTAHFAPGAVAFVGLAAFLGHLYPVWLKFRGGKGVATFIGVMAALSWPVMLAVALVWLALAALLRYSSLAALVASAASPLLSLLVGAPGIAPAALGMAILIWWKHADNIRRLRAGTEPKIGAGKAG